MSKLNEFYGCTAIECVRQKRGRKTYVSYLIEETCRYAHMDNCIYRPAIRKDGRWQKNLK